MFHVTSDDGVSVAVHELAGRHDLPPLLISHATGFHAHCYVPIARMLGDRYRCLGLDFHGHGETAPVPDWTIDWSHFGDDVVAAAAAIAPDGGLVGFGHSMGGAALLMAAHRRPELFTRLVLFEPIAQLPVRIDAVRRRDAADPDRRRCPPEAFALPVVRGRLRQLPIEAADVADDR